MREAAGNKATASRQLGISRTQLYFRCGSMGSKRYYQDAPAYAPKLDEAEALRDI